MLSDDEYMRLQMVLSLHPDQGAVIPGSGGLRKIRWLSQGKGKRGGVRVIYYWYVRDVQVFLLYAYKKSEKEDLSKEELEILRTLIEEEGV